MSRYPSTSNSAGILEKMRTTDPFFFLVGVLFLLIGASTTVEASDEAALKVRHRQNTSSVPQYGVLEITFEHEREYENPFFDVDIKLNFTSPAGKQFSVGGFYYGPASEQKTESQPADIERISKPRDAIHLWKARFSPPQLEKWTYSFVLANSDGQEAVGEGNFTCIRSHTGNHGFVRPDPKNRFRWVFDDGSPYFPIGLQDCVGDNNGNGTVLDNWSLEGPFRYERAGRPDTPLFKPSPSNNPQNADVYFRHYSQCGFNLLRFSQENCSFSIYSDLDHYSVRDSIMVDEYLQCARKYGFQIFYGIFGYHSVFNEEPDNAEAMEKIKRFIKYSVDRWGAYADFWEFLNEQHADTGWYEIMSPYLRSIDPYKHPITTSWEHPELDDIDLNAPHWYEGVGSLSRSDVTVRDRAREWKQFGKPVIVGEQGNWTPAGPDEKPPEAGGVWDPESHLRMRVRNWTAYFNEIVFIFWNTSYAKDGHNMNIWLGPMERQYVKAMQDYVHALGSGVQMISAEVSDPESARAYALASDSRIGAYLVNAKDRATPVHGLAVTVNVPKAGNGFWYSPEDGAVIGLFEAEAGEQAFTVPDFSLDIALLIGTETPPDSDGDGRPNNLDTDDDNDRVPDAEDAFPLLPDEWRDQDGDLIGDNMDADDDGDGQGDDHNGNGIPDHEEMDFDNDGIPRADSVPWDAFPLDPTEWRDADGDGIGDMADPDDDNDGLTDEWERANRLDPTADDAAADPDSDGLTNLQEFRLGMNPQAAMPRE